MEQDLKNLEVVINTLEDCARKCENDGLLMIHLSSIPSEDGDKNIGMVIGNPTDVIINLLKTMSKSEALCNLIMITAEAYKTFNGIEGFSMKS